MKISNNWWTSPQQSAEGSRLVMVTGRDDMQPLIDSGKYVYRVEISWNYTPTANGMPNLEEAKLMEAATDALNAALKKDPVAVMTGIYTGDGKREWIFYTKNLKIFGILLNKALEPLDTMPLVIDAFSDPEWEEYRQMREISYIPPEEEI